MRAILQFAACVFIASLSVSPARATAVYATTISGTLLRFDSSTPGTTTSIGPITGLSAGDVLIGIDFRPANGLLYGAGSLSGSIYSVNTTNGVATVASTMSTSLNGTAFGFDFNPLVDR